MSYAPAKLFAIFFCEIGFVISLTAINVDAQAGRSVPTNVERRVDQLNRQSEEAERDNLATDLKRPSDKRKPKATASEIQRDFKGLQAGYNQIVLLMAAKGALNYDLVMVAIVDIKKCALHLKDSLALPEPDREKTGESSDGANAEQMEGSLVALRKHIYSFVTNPTFESAAVLNVAEAAKARRDLERIIELSDTIKKRSRQPTKPK